MSTEAGGWGWGGGEGEGGAGGEAPAGGGRGRGGEGGGGGGGAAKADVVGKTCDKKEKRGRLEKREDSASASCPSALAFTLAEQRHALQGLQGLQGASNGGGGSGAGVGRGGGWRASEEDFFFSKFNFAGGTPSAVDPSLSIDSSLESLSIDSSLSFAAPRDAARVEEHVLGHRRRGDAAVRREARRMADVCLVQVQTFCMCVCVCVEYVYTMYSDIVYTDIVHCRLHAHVYVHVYRDTNAHTHKCTYTQMLMLLFPPFFSSPLTGMGGNSLYKQCYMSYK